MKNSEHNKYPYHKLGKDNRAKYDRIEKWIDKVVLRIFDEEETVIPIETFQKEGFSVMNAINSTNGPLIEVAGPTPSGYEIVNMEAINRRIYVSNIVRDITVWEPSLFHPNRLVTHKNIVDFQADATQLPIQDNSVGVLFTAYPDPPMRQGLLREVQRVLQEGGLFIYEGAYDEDVQKSEEIGFDMIQFRKEMLLREWAWDIVLQKSTSKTNK